MANSVDPDKLASSWLLQKPTLKKPTDLDLYCLQKQGISGFSRMRVNILDTVTPQCNDLKF